jgi:uncharacterized phage protein (TIGR01671 family)
MDNRFKFRVWDVYFEEMREIDLLAVSVPGFEAVKYLDDLGSTLISLSTPLPNTMTRLMQCTGSTDINEKLIYEGDILERQKSAFYSHKTIFEVVWNYDRYCLKQDGVWEALSSNLINNYFKIIGNIYENPELIITNNELQGEKNEI